MLEKTTQSDEDEYVCAVCGSCFDSAEARDKHLYDMGLLH